MIFSEVEQVGTLFSLAPLIILFPVLGLLINMTIGRRLGERAVGIIGSLAVALSFCVAIIQFVAIQAEPEGVTVMVADWINVGTLKIPWALKIDTLSVTMMLMVTGVSTLIHIYAIGYMHEDVRIQGDPGRYPRFFVYFNLFVATMMILVSADNYAMMFVGWEGVGLCSYLLIGFWFEKGEDGIGNAVAAKKAFITNRVGDFGFMIAMFLIFWTFGTLNFDEVFHMAEAGGVASVAILTAITMFMLLGVTGKSAQIPLHVWLPDAMAGPTPVSALIHAATMVTAGIYLIVRNSVLFDLAPVSASTAAIIGTATAFFAATIALAQFDIKKVLAYSTISQLGFMVAAVGIGGYVAGMFHLITHAFFKALLFLSAGSVIHGVEHGLHHLEHEGGGDHHDFDPQDMRNMGGLRVRMKTTFWVYLIGGLSLAGIPILSGFFSKDEILTEANHYAFTSYIFLTLAAILTAFYIGRQILMIFYGKVRSEAAAHAKENPPVMTGPLIILAFLSVVGGVINLPGLHKLADWLEHTLGHVHITEFDPVVAVVSTLLALASLAVAWLVYGRKPMEEGQPDPLRKGLGTVFVALENKWWVDELYDFLFIRPYVAIANFTTDQIDERFWHDWFHDTVLANTFKVTTSWTARVLDLKVIDAAFIKLAEITGGASARLRAVQTGYIRNYALAILVGFLLILTYLLFL
ncbi:MAG: NADH-quinone oxidoreductase subunit L [Anaerolineales bacterium]|nr:NADH-quinone oxidoreductase subunit L [Anaerolineales bacterium]